MATSGSLTTSNINSTSDYGLSLKFDWSYSNGTVSWTLKVIGGKSSNDSFVHGHYITLKINDTAQTIPNKVKCSSYGISDCVYLRAKGDGADDASYGRTNLASGSFSISNGSTFTVYISGAIYQTSKNHEANTTTFTAGDSQTCYVRVNGVYKKGIPYVRVNGVYKQGIPYARVSGTYKQGT